jgi:hypothetical protein
MLEILDANLSLFTVNRSGSLRQCLPVPNAKAAYAVGFMPCILIEQLNQYA